MSAIKWESDCSEVSGEVSGESEQTFTPRLLTKDEITDIINSLHLYAKDYDPVQENVLFIHKDKTRKKLETIKIKPNKIPDLKKIITTQFYKSIVSAGEAAGVNAAQCISEPVTQQTLNSIISTEEILIQQKNGVIRVVKIGQWIDGILKRNPKDVKHFEHNNTEYLSLKHPVWCPSPSSDGTINWQPVTAVTRHLPGGDLIEIKTASGRKVTVTQCKSVLVWDSIQNKFIEKNGSDVKKGDLTPVIGKFCDPPRVTEPEQYVQKINYGKPISPKLYSADLKCLFKVILEYIDEMDDRGKVIRTRDQLHIPTGSKQLSTGLAVLFSRMHIFAEIKNKYCCIPKFPDGGVSNKYKLVNDVILDPIISVKVIPESEHNVVYDLTVPSTTNFCLFSGLGVVDTFHHSGISAKNVTLGFPRSQELFNATFSPACPTMTIYFNENDTPGKLRKYTSLYPNICINDILEDLNILEPGKYDTWWNKLWYKLHPDFTPPNNHTWCLRIKFNINKLFNHKIELTQIAEVLQKKYGDIHCVWSPLANGYLDILIDCEGITCENTESLPEIKSNKQARIYYIKKVISLKIRNEHIGGIPSVTKVYIRKAKCNETFGNYPLKPEILQRIGDKEEEWIAETDGTNLVELLTEKGVDTTRTMSNDIWEINNIFGIEAARQYLFLEFSEIVKSSNINPVHVQVLVDKMTYTGNIRAFARFGVEIVQHDPISRATFEEVMSQLVTSAMFSETDYLNGISSNIVLGTKIKAGTGTINFENIPLSLSKNPSQTKPRQIISEEL